MGARRGIAPSARADLSSDSAVLGAAALSLCQSLLLALQDRKILENAEVNGLLEDVVSAHRNAAADGEEPEFNNAVADAVSSIIRTEDPVRALRRLG